MQGGEVAGYFRTDAGMLLVMLCIEDFRHVEGAVSVGRRSQQRQASELPACGTTAPPELTYPTYIEGPRHALNGWRLPQN